MASHYCKICNASEPVACTVTRTSSATNTKAGTATYVATCTVDGQTYTDTFTWGYHEDVSRSCIATYTCARGDSATKTVECKVVRDSITEATCENEGTASYTATCVVSGENYTDTNIDTIKAEGHTFKQLDYVWEVDANGNVTCRVSGYCTTCNGSQTMDCNVSKKIITPPCEGAGSSDYTASHNIGDQLYSITRNIKTVIATGHSYGEPRFKWGDNNTCTAEFTCANCSKIEKVSCNVTSTTTAATCTVPGTIVYTATCSFNGKDYQNSKTESISKIAHEYVYTNVYTNNPDGSRTGTCIHCKNQEANGIK